MIPSRLSKYNVGPFDQKFTLKALTLHYAHALSLLTCDPTKSDFAIKKAGEKKSKIVFGRAFSVFCIKWFFSWNFYLENSDTVFCTGIS